MNIDSAYCVHLVQWENEYYSVGIAVDGIFIECKILNDDASIFNDFICLFAWMW